MRHYALGVGEHECRGEVCRVPTSKFTPRYFATSQVWEFSFQIVGEGYAVTLYWTRQRGKGQAKWNSRRERQEETRYLLRTASDPHALVYIYSEANFPPAVPPVSCHLNVPLLPTGCNVCRQKQGLEVGVRGSGCGAIPPTRVPTWTSHTPQSCG